MSSASIPAFPDYPPRLKGNSEAIDSCASTLLRVSATFDDLDTVATSKVRLDGWDGDAADAYARRVRVTATDAAAASAAVRAGAKAMQDYVDRREDLKFRYETLREWRSSLVDLIRHLKAEEIRLRNEPGSIYQAALDARKSASFYRMDCDKFQEAMDQNDADLIAALTAVITVKAGRKAAADGDVADAVMGRPGSPLKDGTPQQVADWWNSLTDNEQFAVIAAYPDVIGAADGLPAHARDRANRILLEQDIAALDLAEKNGNLSEEQLAQRDNIRAAQQALEDAEGTSGKHNPLTRDPITQEAIPAFLLLYQPAKFGNDGTIAIAIGDPDTAQNLAVSVPGINTTGASIPNYTEEAQHLYESARLSDPYTSSATIAWIGYDHPSGLGLGNTVIERAAKDGGERLANYVDGLQASRTTEPRVMTVFGHSYGSTTSSHAAAGPGLDADNLVLLGSPGASGDVQHATDLNVPQVWAGTNSRDIVGAFGDNGWLGGDTLFGAGLGRDPAEDTFGANRFQAEDATRNPHFRNTDDHGKYYERGTESLYNMGQIMVGDYSEVDLADHTYDPWWGPPMDPEAIRTPTPTNDNRQPDSP